MADHSKKIYVYGHWDTPKPTLIGTLFADETRGKEFFAFEYDEEWLMQGKNAFFLDPDLAFYKGRQYPPLNKPLFGFFFDSCPDRWGRLLMKRREAVLAHKEARKPRALKESDFLLGVHDEARMGALRFCLEKEGPFLACDSDLAAPPWTTLRKLEAASYGFERDESGLEEKWLKQLLAPGSSLGGARPKATVQDAGGELWIAKFPSKHDDYNSGAWEKVVHDLAKLCRLNVPESKLETFSKYGSTFLVKRFDRQGEERIHFSSAMTMLGRTDGASAVDGAGYLDIASFIQTNGAAPEEDLVELWRRIVFNMAVSNTDDHLRNHGFLLTQDGWRLSPLFDVNPVPYGEMLSLNVSAEDNFISLDLAVETAAYYGLAEMEARRMTEEITTAVRENWMLLAEKYGLSRKAMEYMRPAFELK